MATQVMTREPFFHVLMRESRSSGGREEVATLEGAAEFLYEAEPRRPGTKGSRRRRAILREGMAEIDKVTVGQPFRLETPKGPLFVLLPLWRFAGCSGPYMGPGNGLKCGPSRPTWPGASRQVRRAAAIKEAPGLVRRTA
jgi:hypothetical protein